MEIGGPPPKVEDFHLFLGEGFPKILWKGSGQEGRPGPGGHGVMINVYRQPSHGGGDSTGDCRPGNWDGQDGCSAQLSVSSMKYI